MASHTMPYQWGEVEEDEEDSIGQQVTFEDEGKAVGNGNTSPAREQLRKAQVHIGLVHMCTYTYTYHQEEHSS